MPKTEEIGMVDSCHIYKTYTVFYLFFIPVCKWNRRYYAKRYYQEEMFEINPGIGQKVERGEPVTIDLPEVQEHRCPYCGKEWDKDYLFCPYCGKRL